jgi:protease II
MSLHRLSARTRIVTATTLTVLAVTSAPDAQSPYAGRGAGSIPAEVIARFAPPPLDAEVSRRIQMMLDVRAPLIGIPAPDGRRLFFGWSITGTPAVWRLDGPRAFPAQMTAGEDPTQVEGVAPDGSRLVLSRERGGDENPGLFLQPTAGGPLEPVHDVAGTRAAYGFMTSDSRWVYFTANDRSPESYAVYRYDVTSRQRELLLAEAGLWVIADRRELPDEVVVLLRKETGSLTAEYAEWSTSTRRLTPLIGHDEPAEYEARYAANRGELFVLTNTSTEFRRLYRWWNGGLEPVTAESPADVAAFHVDHAKRRLYYIVNDGGYSRLRVLDAQTLQPLPFPDIAGAEQVTLGATSPDGRYVTVGYETGRTPRSAFMYDWESSRLVQWMPSAAPETDLSHFVAARLESYPARDGTTIPMFVRYPASCAPDAARSDPCPVVVEFHGGPEDQARAGFNRVAQLFVDAGFVYVQPNVRGSDGYGKAWLDADNGAKRLEVLTDIEDCAKFLRTRLRRGGKAPRIGAFGGSYGGYAALIGMTMFAGSYDAGVSIVGIANFETFLRNTAPYRRVLRISEYGDPDRDAETLRKLSPVTYVERIAGPLLIFQGVDDPRVPVGEALQMYESIQARQADSKLMLLSGEGHGANRRAGQALMIGHALRFFETHLLGPTQRSSN